MDAREVRGIRPQEGWWKRPAVFVLAVLVVVLGVFVSYFNRYSTLVDQIRRRAYAHTADIYAAPVPISPVDEGSTAQVAAALTRAGYSHTTAGRIGRYEIHGDSIAIYPGPESYFSQDGAVVRFSRGRIAEITSLGDRHKLERYYLEPQLVTNVSEEKREKRRLVRFGEIPKVLIDAVVATEDKRFFRHLGFDPSRMLKAAWVDLREGRKGQGASTLSMQLARTLWLDQDKSWRRKSAELFLTMLMEEKLSKQEIFELYANQVYLGRIGTFSIHGFGEAAWVYFGKDLRNVTLSEAATLAGLIQRPGYYNPFRNQDRLRERRNLVLTRMQRNDFITGSQYGAAVRAPLGLSPPNSDGSDAPYFIDLASDEFNERFDQQTAAARVYTTLDPRLQDAAVEAVNAGMKKVDHALAKAHVHEQPQVALVALDPHTGEVKALIGGRDYNRSQLNRALARRQPGSVFKPFVYAAALDTAVRGGRQVFTPASTILDAPATFRFGDDIYEPGNYHQAFYGNITLRRALAKSANVATVKLAEMVGYNAVVDVARRAGLNDRIRATPAVALGAYDVTPLEIAGAYTLFANQGVAVKPAFIRAVRNATGELIYTHHAESHTALNPAVNFLMVDMLEEVLRSGTGASVRSMGFTAPAAGKTGTSHDGWFAGFTPDLLCVVWVGFDDGRELDLEGAKSALPVWAEFMKRAIKYYDDPKPFRTPPGVVSARICPDSGGLAVEFCPNVRTEYFIPGTEPQTHCGIHALSPHFSHTPH